MRIVITGVGSFVGQALLEACKKAEIEVIGIDSKSDESNGTIEADIRDSSIRKAIPLHCDAIVHLAAMSSDNLCRKNGYQCFDVNVLGTLNMINVARDRSAKQFIFMSTEWVYTDFDNEEKIERSLIDATKIMSEYALSKFVSENNIRQEFGHGLCNATILRLGIVYGLERPGCSAVESLFSAVARREPIRVGALKTARRFIHVNDVASAIVCALGVQGFDIFNIQGAKLISLGDIIAASDNLWGVTSVISEADPTRPNIRLVSNDKAIELLGWRANIDLESGLRQLSEF